MEFWEILVTEDRMDGIWEILVTEDRMDGILVNTCNRR
jgi:hypothetical protein